MNKQEIKCSWVSKQFIMAATILNSKWFLHRFSCNATPIQSRCNKHAVQKKKNQCKRDTAAAISSSTALSDASVATTSIQSPSSIDENEFIDKKESIFESSVKLSQCHSVLVKSEKSQKAFCTYFSEKY